MLIVDIAPCFTQLQPRAKPTQEMRGQTRPNTGLDPMTHQHGIRGDHAHLIARNPTPPLKLHGWFALISQISDKVRLHHCPESLRDPILPRNIHVTSFNGRGQRTYLLCGIN